MRLTLVLRLITPRGGTTAESPPTRRRRSGGVCWQWNSIVFFTKETQIVCWAGKYTPGKYALSLLRRAKPSVVPCTGVSVVDVCRVFGV